eukprot:6618380-Karenia_brevis.AAC.1
MNDHFGGGGVARDNFAKQNGVDENCRNDHYDGDRAEAGGCKKEESGTKGMMHGLRVQRTR